MTAPPVATSAPPTTAATLVRRKPPRRVRRRRLVSVVATHAVLIALALAFLLPFVFITLTALMTNEQALSSHLWPHPFRFRNFIDVFTHGAAAALDAEHDDLLLPRDPRRARPSVPVAYALARVRWRGRNLAFLVVLIALMLPPQVTVVPLYVMWAKLHLVGTLWPVIVPNWFGDAFSIFLLRQFFLTIPEEYLDAARVDGCGELRILFTVVTRLAKPALAAVALFCSCTRSTTSSCRSSTSVRTRTTGSCRSGSPSSGRFTRSSGTSPWPRRCS